jgi:gliding motility-associated lipoprotein GldD
MNKLIISAAILSMFIVSCQSDYSPKPRGYFRIELPERSYKNFKSDCNYSFDVPSYASVVKDSTADANECWKNIVYNGLNGRLHLSYYKIKDQKMFASLIEDSRRLVFKHTVKADGISESRIDHPEVNVHGLFYDIEGNAASSIQFFVTDSNKHFLRAALYFYSAPQIDSIKPVLDFVRKDINVMLETFKWK